MASIITSSTEQVKVAGGAASAVGIFWSAVTTTEETAVQPFMVFVTRSVYVPTAEAVVEAVFVGPDIVPPAVVHRYEKLGPVEEAEPLRETVAAVQVIWLGVAIREVGSEVFWLISTELVEVQPLEGSVTRSV